MYLVSLSLIIIIISLFLSNLVEMSSSLNNSSCKIPKLIAFDLDGTIWSPDMYQLWGGGSPFTVIDKSHLKDVSGTIVRLLGISSDVLMELKTNPKWKNTKVAWVSCTDEPSWANDCLHKFQVQDGRSLNQLVDSIQIYKSNKQTHFKNLKKEYPDIDFEEMLFFDNEGGNIRDVSSLKVKCVYCPNGVDESAWNTGMKLFEKE